MTQTKERIIIPSRVYSQDELNEKLEQAKQQTAKEIREWILSIHSEVPCWIKDFDNKFKVK